MPVIRNILIEGKIVVNLFTSKKFVQLLGDSLWLVSLLTVDILKLQFTKILLRSILIIHLILCVIQIFFHFCILDIDDFIKFGPVFFATFYVSLIVYYN
jgi:hypothetical protein